MIDFSKVPGWFRRNELPPVGTVCEYKFTGLMEWTSCRITAIGEEHILFVPSNGGRERCEYSTKPELFRPLRTERELFIMTALNAVADLDTFSESEVKLIKSFSGALYDAGARFQGDGCE